MVNVIFEAGRKKIKERKRKADLIFLSNPISMSLACWPDPTTMGLTSILDPLKLGSDMFNNIIRLNIFIISIIINIFGKNNITIKKNYKFDLKAYHTHLNLGRACLILLLILLYLLLIIKKFKNIIIIEKNHKFDLKGKIIIIVVVVNIINIILINLKKNDIDPLWNADQYTSFYH
jgi:hypothetical protein